MTLTAKLDRVPALRDAQAVMNDVEDLQHEGYLSLDMARTAHDVRKHFDVIRRLSADGNDHGWRFGWHISWLETHCQAYWRHRGQHG